MAKLTITNVTKALLDHRGILLQAANALGCSRPSLYAFIEKHPELEDVRKEAMERLLDVAEGHVSSAIDVGDMKTVRWALERLGKNRGYSTRVETTGADGAPLQVAEVRRTVVDPKEPQHGEESEASE